MKKKILVILVFVATFLSFVYPYRDKDWGWHFRYGEYLFKTGHLLKTDIYSWTMTGFPWTNHEWLFDPVIYTIFKFSGYIGASLAGAIVTFFCFWLLVKKFELSYWKLAIAGFFFSQLLDVGIREGLRGQVLGFIPLAILMYILIRSWEKIKLLWFIPPLMLLWVNLHGSFAFGLLIIAIFFACRLFQKPKDWKILFGTGILSILATLFNPYVLGVYYDVIIHASSPYLKNIFEWLPITYNCDYCHVPSFGLYSILLAVAFIEAPNAQNLPFLITALILIFPSYEYRRNMPVYLIATFPLLLGYLQNLKFDLDKYKITQFAFLVGLIVVIEFNLFNRLPGFHFYNYSEADYCNFASQCPVQLTNFLVQNPPKGKGFNFYDWGGYLIGKGVQARLFIDGRMHLWQTSDGYSPFADLVAIYYDGDINKFNNYNFDWVLVPPNSAVYKNITDKKVQGDWIIRYKDEWSAYFVNAKVQ